jgi:hypothetical protein
MTDKPVRVLRLMEYIYPDAESATRDMARWQVQGTYRAGSRVTIRSTTRPMEVWEAEEPAEMTEAYRQELIRTGQLCEDPGECAVCGLGELHPLDEDDPVLKTPELWAVEHRVHIMDADGWRGGFTGSDGVYYFAKDVDEPVTEAEFIQRLALCTQGPRRDLPPIDTEYAIRHGEDEGT